MVVDVWEWRIAMRWHRHTDACDAVAQTHRRTGTCGCTDTQTLDTLEHSHALPFTQLTHAAQVKDAMGWGGES